MMLKRTNLQEFDYFEFRVYDDPLPTIYDLKWWKVKAASLFEFSINMTVNHMKWKNFGQTSDKELQRDIMP